jgi:hypothetical protein
VLAVVSPGVPFLNAVLVVLPVRFDDLNLLERVELESVIADHVGEVPLLHGFLVVVVLELLHLLVEGAVHLLEGAVDFGLEGVGVALDVGIIGNGVLQVPEDDLELLRQLLVQLLGLVAQVVQLVLLALDLVVLFVDDLLLAEDLVFGVDDSASQRSHRGDRGPHHFPVL